MNDTFYITYAFLMTTATITFIEAIRTKDMKIRNILNLETCISVVAAFFYGKFVHSLENDEEINYGKRLYGLENIWWLYVGVVINDYVTNYICTISL